MNSRSIFKNSFFNIIYNIISLIFPLISSMYVARVLSAEILGAVGIAQNFSSYFVSFASLGIPTYGIREIAKVRNIPEKKNKLFTELIVINTISTTICTAAYFILGFGLNKFAQNKSLFLCWGLSIAFSYMNIDWLYQGEEEYAYITIRSVVVKIMSLAALILLVKGENDYIKYSLVVIFANGFNYLFNVWHARKLVHFRFENLALKQHLPSLMILFVSILMSSIYSKIDITMMGILSTNKAVGYYIYANKIIEVAIMTTTAITVVFLPRLSYLYKYDQSEFYEMLQMGTKIIIFLSVPMTFGIYALATDAVVTLFGHEFQPAGIVLKWMVPLVIIKGLGNLLCYQLAIAVGKEKTRLPAYVAAAWANVILNALLIPSFHERGAAVATVISELLVNGIMLYLLSKEIKIPVDLKSVLQVVAASIFMFFLVTWCCRVIDAPLVRLVLGSLIGIAVYFTIQMVWKNDIVLLIVKEIRRRND